MTQSEKYTRPEEYVKRLEDKLLFEIVKGMKPKEREKFLDKVANYFLKTGAIIKANCTESVKELEDKLLRIKVKGMNPEERETFLDKVTGYFLKTGNYSLVK